LTKSEEEETIIINRPDRSTYPEQKSVSRSGANPIYAGASVALAQVTPAPVVHRAPEIYWAVAGSALVLVAGVIAIVRARRSR
jgi:hypothetical protein